MALHGRGKSAGNIGGGWLKTDAVEAETFDAVVDMENAGNRFFFDHNIRRRHRGVSPDFGACLTSFAAGPVPTGIAARIGWLAGPGMACWGHERL